MPSTTFVFDRTQSLIGYGMLFAGEFVQSLMFLYQEKISTMYRMTTLEMNGWEGLFATSIIAGLLLPLYYIEVGETLGVGPGNRQEY